MLCVQVIQDAKFPPRSAEILVTAAVRVILGNAQHDEGISPGTTYISNDHKVMTSEVVLTLNGTKLTASPVGELVDGEYQYRIGNLVNVIAGDEEDVYNDDSNTFYVNNAKFNINDLVLDNSNFTTNGALIISKNTADEMATCVWCGGYSYAKLYFPLSINNLNELTLSLVSYTADGVSTEHDDEIKVVVDGRLYAGNKAYILKSASNETISNNNIYPVTGTSLASGYRYSNNTSLYLADDTESQANSATFDYNYTTKEGVQHTGTITYKVN